jgi:integrase
MAKPRKNTLIRCRFYSWRLFRRHGAWYADGRSNAINLGRASLGTTDEAEARYRLDQLDLRTAVQNGKADASLLQPTEQAPLELAEGVKLYLQHVGRTRVTGGARPRTLARYKAVMDGVLEYAAQEDVYVRSWNAVNKDFLQGYLNWLEDSGYANATLYLEGTTVKQAVMYFVREEKLPKSSEIYLPLKKPQGTTTYCWTADEVAAMIAHCRARPELAWLGSVIVVLAFTGLRISEAVNLMWTDLKFDDQMIHLVDEEAAGTAKAGRPLRTIKGGRGRSIPMHAEVLAEFGSMARTRDGYVFHGPEGGRLKADTVRRILVRDVLDPLAARFGSPDGEKGFADGRLHSFRHFFCSLCANQGTPERLLMSWLGHADAKMVRRYYHVHKDESRRQMARLRLKGENTGGVAVG